MARGASQTQRSGQLQTGSSGLSASQRWHLWVAPVRLLLQGPLMCLDSTTGVCQLDANPEKSFQKERRDGVSLFSEEI